jgi:hypothetical protein
VFDALLALLHEIRSLAERREKVTEDNFTRFVEDLYKQFQPVARDYIHLFETLGRNGARAGSTQEFDQAFIEFERQRAEFESVRRDIERTASTYGRALNKDDIQELFVSMTYFFYDEGTGGSMSRQMQQRFHKLIEHRKNLEHEREEIPLASPAQTRGAYMGAWSPASPFGYRDPFSDRMQEEQRRTSLEILDEQEKQNRAECVREAEEKTVYCKNAWEKINRQYADLRVKYLLK